MSKVELKSYKLQLSHGGKRKVLLYEKVREKTDYSTISKWFTNFRSICKNLIDQDGQVSQKPWIPRLQDKEANPMSSTRRVSGGHGISLSTVVCHSHVVTKGIRCRRIVLLIAKILKTFESFKYLVSFA